jgi:RNA polymerase sigma-70 factor (ECF subfamily)
MDAAFLRELGACRHELVAFCRSILWKKDDLEDALQEVLLQAVKAFPRFQEGTRFKAWLFRVATHTLWNINRKGRAGPRPGDIAPSDPQDLEVELRLEEAYEFILKDPGRIVTGLGGELRRAVELLNDTERTVFLLRSLCDLRYREIAQALAIPLGSVMGNLGRARAKLRKALVEFVHEV